MALTEEVNKDRETEISRVAFRAPEFWENDPELWFSQLESQFIISGITAQNTKFHAVICALNAKTLSSARDLVKSPPETNPYDLLKERILTNFSQTETSRLKFLLQDCQLGDKRPSQLLVEMRNLACGGLTDAVLKSLWLQRLPVNVQQILSASSENLESLSKIADKVIEVSGCGISVASVSQENLDLKSLKEEIVSLKTEINRLSRQKYRGHQKKPRDTSRRRNLSLSRDPNICWYHNKYKEKAHKCVPPCNFSENS